MQNNTIPQMYGINNQNDTRFFGISRTDLDEFYKIRNKYGLDIYGDLEGINKISVSDNDKQKICNLLSTIKSKFVFTGLPTSGKTTMLNLLHEITGKKIISYDLMKEMEKAKLCKKFGLKKEYLKANFEQLMKNEFNGTYREWLTEVFKKAVRESIENDTLLDIGGYNLTREKEYSFLVENNVSMIYIEIGKANWYNEGAYLANQRNEFRDAYNNDPSSSKEAYIQYYKSIYDIKGKEMREKSTIVVERGTLTPCELLEKSLLSLSNYLKTKQYSNNLNNAIEELKSLDLSIEKQ